MRNAKQQSGNQRHCALWKGMTDKGKVCWTNRRMGEWAHMKGKSLVKEKLWHISIMYTVKTIVFFASLSLLARHPHSLIASSLLSLRLCCFVLRDTRSVREPVTTAAALRKNNNGHYWKRIKRREYKQWRWMNRNFLILSSASSGKTESRNRVSGGVIIIEANFSLKHSPEVSLVRIWARCVWNIIKKYHTIRHKRSRLSERWWP